MSSYSTSRIMLRFKMVCFFILMLLVKALSSTSTIAKVSVSTFDLENMDNLKLLKDKLQQDSVIFSDTYQPLDLYRSRSPIFIGYISKRQWRFNRQKVEAFLLSIIENSLKSDQPKELIVFYEPENGIDEKKQSLAIQILESIKSLTAGSLESTDEINSHDRLKVSIIEYGQESNFNDVGSKLSTAVESASSLESTAIPIQPVNAISETFSPLRNNSFESLEYTAQTLLNSFLERVSTKKLSKDQAEGNNIVEQEFIQLFISELNSIKNSSIVPVASSKPASTDLLTENNLNSALDKALTKHYEKYQIFYQNPIIANSYTLMLLSYRTRILLGQALQNLFKSIVLSFQEYILETFEVNSRKTPTDAKYPGRLRVKANNVYNTFNEHCESVSRGMKSVVKRVTADEGLFSHTLYSKLQSSKIGTLATFDHLFHFKYQSHSLYKKLQELAQEKVDNSFLSGRYNPYVRSHPFPPTRFNFNYLLDPRSLLYSIRYEQLYDEHKEGFTPNRAAPMHIPGVAHVPFDPNDMPTAKDVKPWWEVLQEFFVDE